MISVIIFVGLQATRIPISSARSSSLIESLLYSQCAAPMGHKAFPENKHRTPKKHRIFSAALNAKALGGCKLAYSWPALPAGTTIRSINALSTEFQKHPEPRQRGGSTPSAAHSGTDFAQFYPVFANGGLGSERTQRRFEALPALCFLNHYGCPMRLVRLLSHKVTGTQAALITF